MDSQIVLFLKGKGHDYKGRTLLQLRAMADHRIEKSHDVIQWMFPTDLPSAHCENAPILTDEDIATIREDIKIQLNIRFSLDRMVRFYEKNDYWITQKNHNFLRITRILRFLWLAGRKHDYVCLQKILDGIYRDYSDIIGNETYFYWKGANNDDFLKNPHKYISFMVKKDKEEKERKEAKENPYGYEDGEDQDFLFNYL